MNKATALPMLGLDMRQLLSPAPVLPDTRKI